MDCSICGKPIQPNVKHDCNVKSDGDVGFSIDLLKLFNNHDKKQSEDPLKVKIENKVKKALGEN